MGHYGEKIRKRRSETESGRIALAIMDLERNRGLEYKARYNEIPLVDDFKISGSDDCFVWIISKKVPYKANRYWFKYVQIGMDWDGYVQMLNAQPWLYT